MKKIKLNVEDFQVLSNDELRRIVAGTTSNLTCTSGTLCTGTDQMSDGTTYTSTGQCDTNCECFFGTPNPGPRAVYQIKSSCMATTIPIPPPAV